MLFSLFSRKTIEANLLRVGIVTLIGAFGVQVAQADQIALSVSATANGTINTGANTTLAVPGSHFFGNTQGSLTTPVYTATTGQYAGQSWEFYDDFVFTIDSATANVLTSSIDLGLFSGLNDFQVRLYQLAGNTPLPMFGAPANGTLIQSWNATPINYSQGVTGLISVIDPHALNAGSYVLEVRGNVSGLVNGSYSGVMNLTPVPLPAAAWLLLSGIGGLGAMVRRRK